MTFCDDSADDPSIANADTLVHAVHPNHWVQILGTQGYRVASPSFNESRDGTGNSVNLWSTLQAQGLAKTFVPPKLVAKWKDHGFVEFLAEVPRSVGVKLVRMPLADNPAHAVMCGISDTAKATLSRRSAVISYGTPQKQQPSPKK